MPKSLFEFVAEAIDEVLPANSSMTGREIYMLGFWRYQLYNSERALTEALREIDKSYPLLAGKNP